ncbi:terminase large subunit domain protein [Staphylococcus aureus]|nr:terminase large subunit domain protein [Staphylococcus aureus]
MQDKPYIDYQDVLNWIIKMNEHYVVEKLLMIERTHSN